MTIELSPTEARVIGCLMEKAVTTPDQCPLTLNALTNACNQKSSRDPVMNLSPGEVGRTAHQLEEKFLVREQEGSGRVAKYTQRFCNTPMAEYHFDDAEYALICLLLLRGAQTPGELRARSGRLHTFDDNEAVVVVLKSLMEHEKGPLVARLPRRPGRKDHEYMHLLSGEVESVREEERPAQRSPAPRREGQLELLERRVDALERALIALADRLGEPIELEPGKSAEEGASENDDLPQ